MHTDRDQAIKSDATQEEVAPSMGFEVVGDGDLSQWSMRVNRLFNLAPADLAGTLRAVFITKGGQSLLGPEVDQVLRFPDDPFRIQVFFQPWKMPIAATLVTFRVIQGDYVDRKWYFVYAEQIKPFRFENKGNLVSFFADIRRENPVEYQP